MRCPRRCSPRTSSSAWRASRHAPWGRASRLLFLLADDRRGDTAVDASSTRMRNIPVESARACEPPFSSMACSELLHRK